MSLDRRVIRIGGACGILGVVVYITLAAADPLLFPETRTTEEFLGQMGTAKYGAINMGLHLLFVVAVLLWLVAFLGLQRLLASVEPRLSVRLGTLFGIVACVVMAQMMIVQGSVMVGMGRMFAAGADEARRQSAVALYGGLRQIDYGMDLAFDTFFFTAWIMLGYRMLSHERFGKIFGATGIVLFVIAAILNLYAAPDPPGFDVGPFASLWILAVFIQTFRVANSTDASQATEQTT